MKNNCNFRYTTSFLLLALLVFRLNARTIINIQKIISDTVRFEKINQNLLHFHNVNTNTEIITWNEDKIMVLYQLSYTGSSEKLISQMHKNFSCNYQSGTGNLDLGWPLKNGQIFQNGMRVNGKDYVHVNANVRIFIPATIAKFEYDARFSNLKISKYRGTSAFECEYGNIICDSLEHIALLQNTFGNSTISFCSRIDSVSVKYGNLQLFRVSDIKSIDHSFGRIDIAESPGLRLLNLQYSQAATLKNISDSLLIHSNFSNLNLYLPRTLLDLQVQATYGKLLLHIPDSMAYSLELSTEYGKILSDHVKLLELNSNNPYMKLMQLGTANRILSKSIQGHFCDIMVKP